MKLYFYHLYFMNENSNRADIEINNKKIMDCLSTIFEFQICKRWIEIS